MRTSGESRKVALVTRTTSKWKRKLPEFWGYLLKMKVKEENWPGLLSRGPHQVWRYPDRRPR
jgi:hypothetical protein